MAWQRWGAILALAVLTGCAATEAYIADVEVLGREAELGTRREYEKLFQEPPFARGGMAVTATEAGELRTWRLVPCQGGRAICEWGEDGRAGTLRITPDWYVVSGLFGRTFWLSYAGDGYVQRDRVLVPLAWDARINGPGVGTQAALETTAPH